MVDTDEKYRSSPRQGAEMGSFGLQTHRTVWAARPKDQLTRERGIMAVPSQSTQENTDRILQKTGTQRIL